MTEDPTYELLMLGLPEAGKTSFIHAVDELLQDPPTNDALQAHGLAHDRTYLEREKAVFRAGRQIQRTNRKLSDEPPELWFSHPRTGINGRLFLPDVSGEMYRDQWIEREWDQSYAEALANVSGLLVFARADLPSSNEELLGGLLSLGATGSEIRQWDPKRASAQVQLVDLLQFIAIYGETRHPLRTAVILSAWDVVLNGPGLAVSPDVFLERDWSLLSQYLKANPEVFEYRAYGVSALGGTFEELKQLRSVTPAERVRIADGDGTVSRDLTRPLRWLLHLD